MGNCKVSATSAKAWASCTKHTQADGTACSRAWHADFKTVDPDSDGKLQWSCTVSLKGVHGSETKRVYTPGHSSAQIANARAVSQEPPLRATAALILQQVPAVDMPSRRLLQDCRKSSLKSAHLPHVKSATSMSVWRGWTDAEVARTADESKLHFFEFRILANVLPTPIGANTWITKAFVACVKQFFCFFPKGKRHIINDVSWKMCVSEFGVSLLTFGAQHEDERGELRSLELPISGSWMPKESEDSLVGQAETTHRYYKEEHGIDLPQLADFVHTDGGAAALKMRSKSYPDQKHRLDVRHTIARVKELKGPAEACKGLIAGGIQLSCTMGQPIYSSTWNGFLSVLLERKQWQLIEYVRKQLIRWDETKQFWEAAWRCPVEEKGLTAATLGQTKESGWDSLKDALPVSVYAMDPTEATKHLQVAFEALFQQRKWVVPTEGVDKWKLADQVNGRPWCFCEPPYVMPRLLSGERIQSERLLYEGGAQWKLSPAVQFARYAPYNYRVTELHEWKLEQVKFYTCSLQNPMLLVPEDLHVINEKMFKAESIADCDACFRQLGILAKSGGQERFIPPAWRLYFSNFCSGLVTKSLDTSGVGVVDCYCPLGIRKVQCNHQLRNRWLEGDTAVDMTDLIQFTLGSGSQDPVYLSKQHRDRVKQDSHKTVALVTGNALNTMKSLREDATKRFIAIKGKKDAKNLVSMSLFFDTPIEPEPDATQTEQVASAAKRVQLLTTYKTMLDSATFPIQFEALSKIRKMCPTVAEAREARIGKRIRKIFEDPQVQRPARQMASALLHSFNLEVANSPAAKAKAKAGVASPAIRVAAAVPCKAAGVAPSAGAATLEAPVPPDPRAASTASLAAGSASDQPRRRAPTAVKSPAPTKRQRIAPGPSTVY